MHMNHGEKKPLSLVSSTLYNPRSGLEIIIKTFFMLNSTEQTKMLKNKGFAHFIYWARKGENSQFSDHKAGLCVLLTETK